MNQLLSKKYSFLGKPIVYHTIFWTLYLIFNVIRWGSYFDDYLYSIKSNLVEFPLHIILVYLNLYYLMPRLIPKKLGLYGLTLFLATLVISIVRIILTYWLVTTEIYKESSLNESLFGINYMTAIFVGELYVVGVVTAIKLTIDWVGYKNRTTELEKSNLETELAFLKSQIQPHFFFNTLNNLYALTLEKSDKAPSTVLKLSELMSYVIYDAKQKMVPVIKEVTHIHNYLDLEKLRYGDRLDVVFDIEGKLEGKNIPPVLLLPFVENSFKHGSRTRAECIPITINLRLEDDYLYFSTQNGVQLSSEKQETMVNVNHSGVGLENTTRRLNLLYGRNYNLTINEGESTYTMTLKIPIEL